jgi:uncharacterized membrane protein
MNATARPVKKSRIASIDVMRGLVIVLMLVDHVRETLYLHHQVTDPMDVANTPPDVFFTRMTAHLCAPVFVFLTGLGAWLYAHPASGERSPREFLFKRGLFLVFLELTFVNLSWTGEIPPTTLWLQVIWAIGLSMIALSLMCGLPRRVIAAIGLVIVFGHNLLTPIHFEPGTPAYVIWSILHERNFLVADGPLKIKVTYPVLPWIGVILLGYAAGPLYARTVESLPRTRALIALGIACLAILLVLRGFNIYGETLPWTHGETALLTVMYWIDFTKYPPSLDFLLLTLGVAFLLMAVFENVGNRLTSILVVYGQAPMFFYLIHLYTLMLLYRLTLAVIGPNHGQRWGVDDFYWVWIASVVLSVALYFPTRAFARFKHSTDIAWVRYF